MDPNGGINPSNPRLDGFVNNQNYQAQQPNASVPGQPSFQGQEQQPYQQVTAPTLEAPVQNPFFYLPHTMLIATHGLDDFETSMRAQHKLTQVFTCEFSIRPFLEKYPDKTLEVLARWSKDRNENVRRLVSEGTRAGHRGLGGEHERSAGGVSLGGSGDGEL